MFKIISATCAIAEIEPSLPSKILFESVLVEVAVILKDLTT